MGKRLKKKKWTFKKLVVKLHLWLGLTSGLVVFIVAITGSIFVFSDEIKHALHRDMLHVSPSPGPTIPLSQLWEDVQSKIPQEYELSWVNVYNDPEKSWKFYSYKYNKEAVTYFGSLDYYMSYYVDPYTGEILGSVNEEYEFFNVIKMLHWSLLLETSYGQPIVGWSTFIFVIMLVTGLILWWPKNKSAAKQRFWFRWKPTTRWKRKNYDLHNILGFYMVSLSAIIAFTGMVFAFPWFQSIVYVAASGTTAPPDIPKNESVVAEYREVSPVDSAFVLSRSHHPTASSFRVSPPRKEDTAGLINVYVQQKEGVYYVSHAMQYDRYSGALLSNRTHDDKNFGEKVIAANYDIHVGAILGLPGKILAFIASTICAGLPLTGFLIWWGKRNKSKKNKLDDRKRPQRKRRITETVERELVHV